MYFKSVLKIIFKARPRSHTLHSIVARQPVREGRFIHTEIGFKTVNDQTIL